MRKMVRHKPERYQCCHWRLHNLCLVLYWFYSLVSFFSRSVEGGSGTYTAFPDRWKGERAAFPRQLVTRRVWESPYNPGRVVKPKVVKHLDSHTGAFSTPGGASRVAIFLWIQGKRGYRTESAKDHRRGHRAERRTTVPSLPSKSGVPIPCKPIFPPIP